MTTVRIIYFIQKFNRVITVIPTLLAKQKISYKNRLKWFSNSTLQKIMKEKFNLRLLLIIP